MPAESSPIFIKTYHLIRWTLQHTAKFPRSERYRLASRLENALLNFYECIIQSARRKDSAALAQADVELDKFRLYLRLSREFGRTSADQYEFAAEQVVEIGRLLGGWQHKSTAAD